MGSKRSKYKTNSNYSRSAINLCSLLVTLFVILLAAVVADDTFSRRIHEITRRLDTHLQNKLNDIEASYDDICFNVTYESSTDYNPKGMGGLYKLTKQFMNWTIPLDLIPKGVITITENNGVVVNDLSEQLKSLAGHFAGLIVLLLIFALMLVCFPFCGLCFCCCRCCGNCGAKSQPFDKKNDLCKKIILASLLIVAGTLLLFGIVCAFVSNQQIQEGTEEFPQSLRTSLKDTNTYLGKIVKQFDILLNVNFGQFKKKLFETLDETSNIVFNELGTISQATSLEDISNITSHLDETKNQLSDLTTTTNSLRTYASQLNDALRKVKYDLLKTLKNCEDQQPCKELLNSYVTELKTTIDFNSIPDISKETNNLSALLEKTNISEAIETGKQQWESIKDSVSGNVQNQLGDVRKTIEEVEGTISASMKNVTSVIDKANSTIVLSAYDSIDIAEGYIRSYSPYRYYVGLAMSCVLLLVAICIALGLICGICGKRPDSYGDDCCNKGSGSRFLMCGVGIMFLFAIILVVLTIVYFAIGVFAQRVVCDPLRDPESSYLIELVDDLLKLQSIGVNVTIKSILQKCNAGESVYNVMNLQDTFDLNVISNFSTTYNINDKLEALKHQIAHSADSLGNITLLNDESKKALDELVTIGIQDIPFDRFIEEVNQNFTSTSLEDLRLKIDEVAGVLDKNRNTPDTVMSLKLTSLHLQTYEEKIVTPMNQKAQQVREDVKKLQTFMSFGNVSFEQGITTLKEEIENAEKFLRVNGSTVLIETATTHIDYLVEFVDGFLNHVVTNVRDNVGTCEPLNTVIDATLVSTCDKIIQPVNGFWFGVFWSLILFIPIIILSVKLATLYKKYDPYPGSMVEAEYLYDAYADRENIPLSGMSSKHNKKRKNKKNKRYDNRGAYVQESGDHGGREFPAGPHHQDARYADMAPKGYTAVQYHFPTVDGHWEDFPAGGPPQYQRAPTEYDRPPPYYYPGTAEQQH